RVRRDGDDVTAGTIEHDPHRPRRAGIPSRAVGPGPIPVVPGYLDERATVAADVRTCGIGELHGGRGRGRNALFERLGANARADEREDRRAKDGMCHWSMSSCSSFFARSLLLRASSEMAVRRICGSVSLRAISIILSM